MGVAGAGEVGARGRKGQGSETWGGFGWEGWDVSSKESEDVVLKMNGG